MQERSPRFPNKLVVIGAFFILAGAVLLLWTAGYLDQLIKLWPLVPVLAGLALLYFRIFQSAPDYYVFLSTGLLLTGVLFLLVNTIAPVELIRIWPLFMTVIGVALSSYGFRKPKSSRLTFVVPGGAMILLSVIFLPFSLELVSADFARFVGVWWPVLLVITGAVLILVHAGRGSRQ